MIYTQRIDSVSRWSSNGRPTRGGAAIFAFGTGVTMIALYFFSPNASPVPFYLFAALSQFFFSGFNTAIYTIIPDCVEYGEWVTGVRNDGFQYAFISLGNKIGMVLSIMRHAFSTIPGILWVATAAALFFYKLNKRTYNRIVEVIRHRAAKKRGLRSIAK